MTFFIFFSLFLSHRRRTPANAFRLFPTLCMMALGCWIGCASGDHKSENSLDRIQSHARQTRERLLRSTDAETGVGRTHALQVLDGVLDYIEQVRSGPNQFNAQQIRLYTRRIDIISGNIERFRDPSLGVELGFPRGGFRLSHLSSDQRGRFDRLRANIVRTVEELHESYSEDVVRITIKSVGYTDELPILPSHLQETILKQIAHPAASKIERRRQQNQVLSRLRAATISDNMVLLLRRTLPGEKRLYFAQIVSGKGEVFPRPMPETPYRADDERRRICRLQAYIEIVP